MSGVASEEGIPRRKLIPKFINIGVERRESLLKLIMRQALTSVLQVLTYFGP